MQSDEMFNFTKLREYCEHHQITIISFIGYSHSGKTASIEAILQWAETQQVICMVIKKTNHDQRIFDTPGKNTWKYSESGAKIVSARSNVEVASFINGSLTNSEFEDYLIMQLQFLHNIHPRTTLFLLSEGFRNLPTNQILCAKTEEEIQKQITPMIRVIAGRISSPKSSEKKPESVIEKKTENTTKIALKYRIPIINCLTHPEDLFEIIQINH